MTQEAKCPICKKTIYVAEGQRMLGCKDCRKEIRIHNRKVVEIKKYKEKHGIL